MKRLFVYLSMVACLGLAPTLLTAAPEAARPTLHVEVITPPMADTWVEDQVRRALFDNVYETFHRRGFAGRIEERRFQEAVPAEDLLLTIRLTRWRQTRTGGVDCSFTATLRPPHGEATSLGHFTSTDLGLGITSRWSLAEAFRNTARQAADDLWRRLSRSDAAPGLFVAKR
jgi:hypothetical protein